MTTEKFSSFALQDLRDRVSYEIFFLQSTYNILEEELFFEWPDSVVYEIGSASPNIKGNARVSMIMGDWRSGFLVVGAPLIFVTTFKLLDMLFEWIIEQNSLEKNSKKPIFSFEEKIKKLNKNELEFPAFLSSRPWLIDCLRQLFVETTPLRGTLIHSRHFKSDNGSLVVASSRKDVVGDFVELSASDLRKFAQLCICVYRFIQEEWPLNEHRDKFLRWQVDELEKIHKLKPLGQQQPFHTRVRWKTRDHQIKNVDIERISQDVKEKHPYYDMTFDLRIVLYENQSAVKAYLIPYEKLAYFKKIQDFSCFECKLPDES